jgi:hypothetical protein
MFNADTPITGFQIKKWNKAQRTPIREIVLQHQVVIADRVINSDLRFVGESPKFPQEIRRFPNDPGKRRVQNVDAVSVDAHVVVVRASVFKEPDHAWSRIAEETSEMGIGSHQQTVLLDIDDHA